MAVLLFNQDNYFNHPLTVQWTQLGWSATQSVHVRDVWAHSDAGVFQNGWTADAVLPRGVSLVVLTPQ